jgi:predicted ATPase
MARLDRLGSAKEVAQIGAAIGREFSHALLSAVVSRPEQELVSSLDRLIHAGLLFRRGVPPHASYLFKHALVQDAAYGTLLRGQRQQLHGRIAKTLESRFPELKATQPESLAQHYAQAGLNEPALKFWLVAGDLAERRAMGREAVAHYRAARALLGLPGLSDEARGSEPMLLMKLESALQQIEGYNSAAAFDAYEILGPPL